jgi:predicted MPP superfamily phosphohydrolase
MIRMQRSLEALWSQLLWLTAASCAWAVLVTERVLEIRASPLRGALIALSFVCLMGLASWVARRLQRSRLRFLPLLVLAGIGAREWHRRALRGQYRASAPLKSVGLAESLWHPVTTTDIVVRYYALASNKLALQQLRVVLLADLHVTPLLPRAYYEHVFELVAAQHADLVLLAGDYVSEPENMELMTQRFAQPWPARLGVFAVLGNHDIWTSAGRIREVLSATGVTLVSDHCEHLPKAIGRIAICGTEAPWGPEPTFALDRAELNLVLSHTPDNVFRLAEQGASVVFSGHTHGGQIRLPALGSLVVPSRFGRLFDEGHFRVGQTDLFVTTGIGADMPPVRIYCPPEILVIDITRQ